MFFFSIFDSTAVFLSTSIFFSFYLCTYFLSSSIWLSRTILSCISLFLTSSISLILSSWERIFSIRSNCLFSSLIFYALLNSSISFSFSRPFNRMNSILSCFYLSISCNFSSPLLILSISSFLYLSIVSSRFSCFILILTSASILFLNS